MAEPRKGRGIETRLFTTMPTRAIFMPDLTALDMRVLAIVAMHDGMTLHKAKASGKLGAGCTASNITLAREAQCSYEALTRALGKLQRLGLIEKQDRRTGNRQTVIRVRYDPPDNVPQGTPDSADDGPQYDQGVISDPGQYDEPPHKQYDELAQTNTRRAAENCAKPLTHYNSLRGELDSVETGGLDTPKVRTFDARGLNPPKGGLPKVSVRAHLPASFDGMKVAAQVAALDRALRKVACEPEEIDDDEWQGINALLWSASEDYAGEPTGHQAHRLLEQVARF